MQVMSRGPTLKAKSGYGALFKCRGFARCPLESWARMGPNVGGCWRAGRGMDTSLGSSLGVGCAGRTLFLVSFSMVAAEC